MQDKLGWQARLESAKRSGVFHFAAACVIFAAVVAYVASAVGLSLLFILLGMNVGGRAK